MKNNTQKGPIVALIIIIILIVAGLVFYHPKNTSILVSNMNTETASSTFSATSTVVSSPANSMPAKSISSPSSPLTVTEVSNVPAPVITSIQPSTVHISNTINVYGKGFENLGPSSEVQVKITDLSAPSTPGGFVSSVKPILDTYVSFNLQSKYCAGITTLPCTPETPVAPGSYSLQVRLENGTYSNAVDFTVIK